MQAYLMMREDGEREVLKLALFSAAVLTKTSSLLYRERS